MDLMHFFFSVCADFEQALFGVVQWHGFGSVRVGSSGIV